MRVVRHSCVVVAVALAFALSACLPVAKKQTNIIDADASMVAACDYLGEVNGMSGFSGPLGADYGMSKAQNLARHQAEEKGATHVVWNGPASNMVSTASGKAYRCADGASRP